MSCVGLHFLSLSFSRLFPFHLLNVLMSVCLSVLFLLSPSCFPISVPLCPVFPVFLVFLPCITHVPRVLHIPAVFMFPVFLVFPVSIVFLPMFPVLLWLVSCFFFFSWTSFILLIYRCLPFWFWSLLLSTFCWLPFVFAFCIFLFLLDFASSLYVNKACFIFTCLPLAVLHLGSYIFMIFMYSWFKSHQHNNHS